MNHFEKFENQLISSYESTLAVEGEEICKEVDSILEDNDELLVEKLMLIVFFVLIQKELILMKNCLKDVKSI